MCGLVSWACVSILGRYLQPTYSYCARSSLSTQRKASINATVLLAAKTKPRDPRYNSSIAGCTEVSHITMLSCLIALTITRPRCLHVPLVRCQCYFLHCIRIHQEAYKWNVIRRRASTREWPMSIHKWNVPAWMEIFRSHTCNFCMGMGLAYLLLAWTGKWYLLVLYLLCDKHWYQINLNTYNYWASMTFVHVCHAFSDCLIGELLTEVETLNGTV